MTRFTCLAAFVLLTGGAAFSATQSETTTYVDGNLTGVSPNTGGTLLFSDDKAMYFRTGLATVAIPYAGVTKAELGATKVNSHDVPLYKVWSLHKRFTGKTQTQFLVVEFKSEEGEDKTMTLELAHSSAASVLSTIQSHTSQNTALASAAPAQADEPAAAPAPTERKILQAAAPPKPAAKPAEEWWGDNFWKTTRNADKWSKPAGTNAPED